MKNVVEFLQDMVRFPPLSHQEAGERATRVANGGAMG
jgi:hypothetical protein